MENRPYKIENSRFDDRINNYSIDYVHYFDFYNEILDYRKETLRLDNKRAVSLFKWNNKNQSYELIS